MNQVHFSNIVMTILSVILAAFFGIVGIIGIVIPWSPQIRTDIIQFILEDFIAISLFGFGFLIIGLVIIINLILSTKKRYYYLRSSRQFVALDEAIFQEYISGYWRKIFPNSEVAHRIELKKNKLYISADLPYIPQAQQKLLLEKIRNDLVDLFGKMLGYQGEFFLTTNFALQK